MPVRSGMFPGERPGLPASGPGSRHRRRRLRRKIRQHGCRARLFGSVRAADLVSTGAARKREHMRRTTLVALFCATLAGQALLVGSAQAVNRTGHEFNTLYAGLGIKGYDPVAYFTDGKATPGKKDISFEWGGVKWLFASREHRDAFMANPTKYAPQYGGFCAWGVAEGKLLDVGPEHGWKIVDGKLYMTFNAAVPALWWKDIPGLVHTADAKWPALDQ